MYFIMCHASYLISCIQVYFSKLCRVSSEDPEDIGEDHDDGDTSGVRVLLTSPDASDAKDREIWCTPEEVLAMLLAGVKVGGGGYFLCPQEVVFTTA